MHPKINQNQFFFFFFANPAHCEFVMHPSTNPNFVVYKFSTNYYAQPNCDENPLYAFDLEYVAHYPEMVFLFDCLNVVLFVSNENCIEMHRTMTLSAYINGTETTKRCEIKPKMDSTFGLADSYILMGSDFFS